MKSKPLCLLACTAALLMLLPLRNAHAQQPARTSIEAGNKKFLTALSRGDAAELAALYTTNAQVFPAHSDIVRGKQAIEQFWKGAIDSGIKGAELKTLEVEQQGDMACEVGTYEMTAEGGKMLDKGKYVVIWKRERGEWKIHRDIWNTSQPAPGQ